MSLGSNRNTGAVMYPNFKDILQVLVLGSKQRVLCAQNLLDIVVSCTNYAYSELVYIKYPLLANCYFSKFTFLPYFALFFLFLFLLVIIFLYILHFMISIFFFAIS